MGARILVAFKFPMLDDPLDRSRSANELFIALCPLAPRLVVGRTQSYDAFR